MTTKKKRSEVKAYHLVHHGTNRQFARFGNLDPETIAKLKKKHPEWDWREEKIAWHFSDDPNLAHEYGNRLISAWIDTENFKLFNFRGYHWTSDHGEKLNNVITQAKEKGYSGLIARNIVMGGKDPESPNIKSDHYIAWKPHTVRSVSSGEEIYEENEAGLSRVTSGSSFHQASSNVPQGDIKLPTVLDAGPLAKTKTPDFFNYFRQVHADNKEAIKKQQEQMQKEQEKAQKQQEKAIKKQEQLMKKQEQQQKKAAKEQQKALKRMFESVRRYSSFITEQSVKTAPDFSRPQPTAPSPDTPTETEIERILKPYTNRVDDLFSTQGAGRVYDKATGFIKKYNERFYGNRYPTNSINQPPGGGMEILRPSAPKLGQSQQDSNIDYNNRIKQQENFDRTGIDKLSLTGFSDLNQRRLRQVQLQQQPVQQAQQQQSSSSNDPVHGAMNILQRPNTSKVTVKNPMTGSLPQSQPKPQQYQMPRQQQFISPFDTWSSMGINPYRAYRTPFDESVIDRFLELEKSPSENQFAKAKKLYEIFGKDNNQKQLKKANGNGDQMAKTIPVRDLTDAVIRKEGKQAAFTGSPFNAAGVSGSPGSQAGPAPSKINDNPTSGSPGDSSVTGSSTSGGASPEQQVARQGAFSGSPFNAAGIPGSSGTQSGGNGKNPTTGPEIIGTNTTVVGGPPQKLPVSPESGGKRR